MSASQPDNVMSRNLLIRGGCRLSNNIMASPCLTVRVVRQDRRRYSKRCGLTFRTFSPKLTAGMSNVLLASAINGSGMAWLPASTVGAAIQAGSLQKIISPDFPETDLHVSMLSLRTPEIRELDALVSSLGSAITHAVKLLREGCLT